MEPSLYALLVQVRNGAGVEKVSFKEKLIESLSQKGKTKLKEDENVVVDKLRRQERLTDDEFWSVYGSIRQEGQDMKSQNPTYWIYHDK